MQILSLYHVDAPSWTTLTIPWNALCETQLCSNSMARYVWGVMGLSLRHGGWVRLSLRVPHYASEQGAWTAVELFWDYGLVVSGDYITVDV